MDVVLETERMRLRRMGMGDVDNLLQIFSDPVAMHFYPGTKDVEATRGWIDWTLKNYEKYGHGFWICELKETGTFVGQCGVLPQMVEDTFETEIGYLFVRRYWNQGLATEAAMACRDYAFDVLGRKRVISLIHPENWASRRVAEKNGLRPEKEIMWRGTFRTLIHALERSGNAETER